MHGPRLADFAGRAYSDSFKPEKGHKLPFNGSDIKNTPTLRTNGVNRILLFPGSFNPPHQGHWNLLNHVFNNAGDDLQLAATIIIPTSDRRLARKTFEESESLILPQRQRAQLWNKANVLNERMWVFDREEDDWSTFRKNLESEFSKAELNVKFIMLTGPDYVSQSSTTDPHYWGVKDTVTSDISRPVDFIMASGALSKVYPCSDWKHPQWNLPRFVWLFREKMPGQPEHVIQEAAEEAARKMASVWTCHRRIKPSGNIRFVWTGQSVPVDQAPSSTKIRKLLKEGYANIDFKISLVAMALSPDLLEEFSRTYATNPELQKFQAELRERAAKDDERDWKDKIQW